MDLNIKAEDVNKLVADAVLESAIGDAVKTAVGRAIESLTRTWDNPIEQVVKNHVAEMVRKILIQEHEPHIREALTKALSEKLSSEFIERVVDKAADKYV